MHVNVMNKCHEFNVGLTFTLRNKIDGMAWLEICRTLLKGSLDPREKEQST